MNSLSLILSTSLVVVHGKLSTRVQEIIHNNLIMQWEDWWKLWFIVLFASLNLLVS